MKKLISYTDSNGEVKKPGDSIIMEYDFDLEIKIKKYEVFNLADDDGVPLIKAIDQNGVGRIIAVKNYSNVILE